MASQVASNILTTKERRFAVNHLKESKEAYLKSVKGLSAAQLSFKPASDRWSVQECMMHIALAEDGLWQMVTNTLQQPANAQNRDQIQVSDEDLLKLLTNREQKAKASETLDPAVARWPDAESALKHFKDRRQETIRYVKTTTDDLRNHVAQMPFGALDTYQLLLLISGHTARHTAQINEIKAHPGFPKQ